MEKDKKNNTNLILIIIGSFVLGAIIVGGLIFYINNHKSNHYEDWEEDEEWEVVEDGPEEDSAIPDVETESDGEDQVNEYGATYVNDPEKLKKGIVGEITYPCADCENSKYVNYTLYKNHTLYKGVRDGDWNKVGKAIVIFTGEGTTYYTILNGYVYEGMYHEKSGLCSYEDWNEETEGLEDFYYRPTPSKGVKLTRFEIYTPELK